MTYIRYPHYRSPMDSPHKGPVMWRFDISLHVNLNKLLNKMSRGMWTEMSWRLFDVTVKYACSAENIIRIYLFVFITILLRMIPASA